jgi:hypothetical protein
MSSCFSSRNVYCTSARSDKGRYFEKEVTVTSFCAYGRKKLRGMLWQAVAASS